MKNLYIKQVEGKGRGVFSKEDIKAGDIVEISPVFIISGISNNYNIKEEHEYRINGLKRWTSDKTIMPLELNDYSFSWSFLTKNGKKDECIALGYGSLYNSANPANMRYEADEKNLNILFIAVIDIPKDTELTINYSGISGNHISDGNRWFENKNFIK
jgi:hypothetical protein